MSSLLAGGIVILCSVLTLRKCFVPALLACVHAHAAPGLAAPIADTIAIHIAVDAQVRARTVRVSQGAHVRLDITAERAITVHLHGYDIERRVTPGTVTIAEFDAASTGRFPMTTHDAGKRERVVLYVEVHPR